MADIGALILLPPAYKQGYYWKQGMTEPCFCDNFKKLPNDVIWISSADFEHAKDFGRYIKNDRFLRVPVNQLLRELGAANVSANEQAIALGMALTRLHDSVPNALRMAGTLSQAYSSLDADKTWDTSWDLWGKEARTYFWKGSSKSRLLLGGSACLPRFDYNQQLLKCPILDLSAPPEIINFKQGVDVKACMDKWRGKGGFASVRIENLKTSVLDFISLDRTLITITELNYLMLRAKVTVKNLYLCPLIKHPYNKKSLMGEFQPFSWLDGLRLEALYYAAGVKNPAQEAWLRAQAHVAAAFHAEYLNLNHDIACLTITHGKIGIACSESEIPKVKQACMDSGVWMDLVIDPV